MALLNLLSISTLILTASTQQTPLSVPAVDQLSPAQRNAPQIFNAIHSSMRQWGSSLNHNGMSFFPATIPNNTQLYHGTTRAEAITGMEWLAFEIEHAEVFSRPRRGGPPGKGPGGGPPPGGPPGEGPPPLSEKKKHHKAGIKEGDDEDIGKGYLHIYRTTRPLTRLLYIDGMSAGKTSMGTLDTQDLILRNTTTTASSVHGTAPWSDEQRAIDLCELGKGEGIEGFIRMEAGFEVILCEFRDGLELVEAVERPGKGDDDDGMGGFRGFEYIRGVGMRYEGITAGRVNLDFSSMVSAFFYDVNLTNPDPELAVLPRLPADDAKALDKIKKDVLAKFKESTKAGYQSIDWQGVVDMIVTRYSDRLQFMAGRDEEKEILSEINFLLTVFINYRDPDIETAIGKCCNHYLNAVSPSTSQDLLIYEAILTISHDICSTLFKIRGVLLEEKGQNKIEEAKELLGNLIKTLDWSTWLQCGKCAYDEVCFVAIWPMGGKEDHEHPSCVGRDKMGSRRGYWGAFGGPPREHPYDGREEL